MYYKDDPLKPIIFIGIILYKFENNKFYILLSQNLESKYDLIYEIYADKICTNELLDLNDIINNRIYNATNYLIDFKDINKEQINKEQINDFYDDITFGLIRFIKLPDKYTKLTSFDFNLYEIQTDEKKIKRKLIWIEYKYFNNFLLKNNKVTHKLKNKDIIKNLNKIYKNYNLYSTLNKIKLYK
jgi:hypothetical protein